MEERQVDLKEQTGHQDQGQEKEKEKARFNAYGEKIMSKEEVLQDMADMRKRLLKRSLIRTAIIILIIVAYMLFSR